MKKRNTIKAAAILCITALCINTSCTNDEATNDATLRPIELKAAGLTAIGNTRSTVDGDWDGTSVKSVAIQIGSEVKQYTITPSIDNTTATIAALKGTTPFYWDTETKTVTAWYPYSAEYPTSWEVKTDQSIEATYLACDLLKAESKEITYGSANTIEFEHQVARITITITDGITDNGDKQDATSLTILGSYTPYHTSTGTYDLLLAPQDIASGTQLFTLVTADGAFAYSVPSTITLTANQHLIYNVKTTLDGLEVTSVSNETGWTSGGSETVESIDLSKYGIDLSKYDGIVFLSNLTGTYTTENTNVLIIGDGNTYSCPIVVSESTSNVTLLNVKLSVSNTNPIMCNGDVTLTLMGNNELKESYGYYNYSAINIAENKTLTIDGTGSLTVSSYFGAGIGCNSEESCGNIVINNSTINATSKYGAGIGAGQTWYSNPSSCGTITINGGTINATSDSGAGIGSGRGSKSTKSCPSSCGKIAINGGTITATSNDGAGIGSGYNYSECNDIEITGGNITAKSTDSGAGIGSGYCNSSCGTITISGSNTVVTAKKTGNYSGGSDIGAGRNSSCGTVTISGGATVNDKTYE